MGPPPPPCAAPQALATLASAVAAGARWLARRAERLAVFLLSLLARAVSPSPAPGFSLKSAFVYGSDGHAACVTEEVRAILADRDDGSWESRLAPSLPDWRDAATTWRVEARYELNGRKYRALARPGSPFPAIARAAANARLFRVPRVLVATLVASDGRRTDITRRVHKYLGPRGDWHGSRVESFDLFPSDDPDHHLERGYTIELFDAGFEVRHVRFEAGQALSE